MKPRERLALAKRIVVKVGSALLADQAPDPFARLAADVAAVRAPGKEVVVVSSGAIALGWPLLGYDARPKDLPGLQAAAAAGQGKLIGRWSTALEPHGVRSAQVLLTHGDLQHRRRYLNARHALNRLIERGAIPICNENDTVSVDEIKLGDNDRLAAAVCGLITADLVILLTGADGLLSADPNSPAVQRGEAIAERLSVVETIDDRILAMAGPAAAFGTGGMATKLQAAQIARAHGAATVIAPGRRQNVLEHILAGHDIGTLIVAPDEAPERARKRWILTTLRSQGALVVDAGAHRALLKGASLLAAGVREVLGSFSSGDAVDVRVEGESRPFARGLCAVSGPEAKLIAGRSSSSARELLGPATLDELIHRDDLALLEVPHVRGS